MTDVLIIGGGMAGMTAALYAARAGLQVVLIEKEVCGGQATTCGEIENYPTIKTITGADFSFNLYEQVTSYPIHIEYATVTQALLGGEIKVVAAGDERLEAKTVIIAGGVKRRELGCEGEKEFTGRGVSYCAVCDGNFFKGKQVAVVGGGNTALEDALYLSRICEKVTLIHRRDFFRAEPVLIERVLHTDTIHIVYNSQVTKIEGDNRVNSITLKTENDTNSKIAVDAVFIAVGMIPDNGLYANELPLDKSGYFQVGEDCMTPVKGVYVAGDCRSKEYRQLITAGADGAVAALQAARYLTQQS